MPSSSKEDKRYRVICDGISFEPVDKKGIPLKKYWRGYGKDEEFSLSDVTCPGGQRLNIARLLDKGAIKEV